MGPRRESTTIFVVDDDEAVCRSLKWLLESERYRVEAFLTPEAFLRRVEKGVSRGCVLLDVKMPRINGVSVQERLRKAGVKLPVIIISGHADVPTAVQAMRAGAVDVLEKPFEDDKLLGRVREAIEASEGAWAEARRVAKVQSCYASLSDREKEVMALVVLGHSNKEVARRLRVTTKTVEAHRANVMRKMGAENLPDLVRHAVVIDEHGP